MEVDVKILFPATITGRPVALHSDVYEGAQRNYDRARYKLTSSKSSTATVEVYYDPADPSNVDFAEVELSGMSPYVDVSHLFED